MKPFDQAGHFQGHCETVQLSKTAIRNSGITITAQAVIFVIQMSGTLVLARILNPSDFGVITMVTTFSLLLSSFGLAGFTEAVIQAEEINHALASTLFWINLGGGCAVAVAFAEAGPLLARFYAEPRIRGVCIGISLAIFFSVAPILHLALLKRSNRFSALAVNDIAGRCAYVVTALVCALCGWHYWALVAAAVVQPMVLCIGAIILCPWIPCRPQKGVGAGKLIRYARDVYGRFSLNYCTGNTDNLLVGWRFGASTLGYYKKAFDIFVLPSYQLMTPVLAVVVGTLSRKSKDHQEFKRYFIKGLGVVALLGMGISADLTLVGRDLVRLILGAKWTESGYIFTFFAPGIGLMLIYQSCGWIHLSLGTTGRWLRWTVIEVSLTALLFVIGLNWGPAGVAGAWTLSFVVLTIPAFGYAGKPIGLSASSVLKAIWRYALASVAACLATEAVATNLAQLTTLSQEGMFEALSRAVTISIIFTCLYAIALIAIFRSMEPVHLLTDLFSQLFHGLSSRFAAKSANELPRSWSGDVPQKQEAS